MTITCGIQPTGVVTMAMKVLHNSCNMYICDMPDMNALIPWAVALGYTYQANPPCPCYNHYIRPITVSMDIHGFNIQGLLSLVIQKIFG